MSRNDDFKAGYFAELATQVARNLRKDGARKARILAESPHLHALDGNELAQMSARELAVADLKQYGIEVTDASDPIEVRDAFHAGRQHERRGARPMGMDSAGGENFLDRYLKE